MGRTGKSNGKRRSLEKSLRSFLPGKFLLSRNELQGRLKRFASSEFLLPAPGVIPEGSAWRLPVRTVTLCSSHSNNAMESLK